MAYITNSVTRAVLGGGITCLLLGSPTSSYHVPRFPQSTVLSGEDIEEAVMRGRSGQQVLPYFINRPIGGGSAPRAVVYTPFVRVALAAMAGVLTFDGVTISSQVSQRWIASPEVLVVIGSPCPGEPACEFGGEVVDPIAVSPTRLYIRHQVSPPGSSAPAVATPIRQVPLREIRWLGSVPVKEPVVAATFSPQEFRVGSSVVAEWGRWDSVTFLAGGHIQRAELETWR